MEYNIDSFKQTLETLPLNTMVKVHIYRDYRDMNEYFIAKFNGYNNKVDNADFGHPVNIETKECNMGGVGARKQDIVSIGPITDEEYELWVNQYKDFHKSVVEEKGYDWCTEDMTNVRIYIGPEFSGLK